MDPDQFDVDDKEEVLLVENNVEVIEWQRRMKNVQINQSLTTAYQIRSSAFLDFMNNIFIDLLYM